MIKSSNKERKIISEYITISNVPTNIIKLLKCNNEIGSIKKFSNKEGIELVDYGINAFVRDIFVNEKTSIAIYSDRFGKYHKIENTEIANFLINAHLHITPEGILFFYSNNKDFSDYIYLTLNCKFGIFTKISSLIESEQKIRIFGTFNYNNKTFVRLCIDTSFTPRLFYCLLEFSINLYESYGSIINVKVHKLQDTSKSEILKGHFRSDFECTEIKKSNKIIELNSKLFDCPKSKFKKLYKKDIKLEKCEKINSVKIRTFSNNGDIKINDCINAFVKSLSIAYLNNSIKYLPFDKELSFKYILILYNRYLDYEVRTSINSFDITNYKFSSNSIETDIAKTLYNSSIYVSSEGVIVAIKVYTFNKIVILISLDGIIWKSYDIINNETKIRDNLFLKVKFTQENNYNFLILYNTLPEKPLKKYILQFKFNFWDLYNYPVELSIDSID